MDEISTVTCPTLTEANVADLHAKGVIKLLDFFKYSRDVIIRVARINFWEYETVKNEILQFLRPPCTTISVQCKKNMTQLKPTVSKGIVSTGIRRMDRTLRGGFRGGEIVEIFGKSGSGKSKFCSSMALQCCQHENSMAVYIDTRNDFSVYSSKFPSQSQAVLQRLRIFKRFTLEETVQTLSDFNVEMSIGQMNMVNQLRILIVDSLPMIIYPAITSTDIACWRHHLESFMEQIRILAGRGFLILIVNHAVSGNYGRKLPRSNRLCKVKPALGKYWTHQPNFSIALNASRSSSIIHAEFVKTSRKLIRRAFPIEKSEIGAD